jgi:hypothetical protein
MTSWTFAPRDEVRDVVLLHWYVAALPSSFELNVVKFSMRLLLEDSSAESPCEASYYQKRYWADRLMLR